MADPVNIAKRLRESKEQSSTEAEVLNEQLALVDVVIDEYDELINKLDVKIPPLLAPINEKIKAVETAYHARISHGCRSDLVWQLQETKNNWYNQNVQIYKVVKDPATFRFLGFYGAKYWKYPKNREYGANVVEIIDNADARVGSASLVMMDDDAGDMIGLSTSTVTATIKVGDLITDSLDVTLDYAVLSNPVSASIASTIGTSFYVGVVSTYYNLSLTAEASTTGINSSFLVVRPGDTSDIAFESSKNPIDPVEIGIAKGASVGKGHVLELINNGDPDIIANWSEIKEEPEPAVGNGRVEYWIGTTNWPVYYPFNSGGGPVDPVYAAEGHQIVIAIGGTANSTMAYENVPPGGSIPGDCGTYDAAISTAEAEMNEIIAKNTPIINHYISGADSLRQLRNEDETQAWGYMQAIGFLNAKAKRQLGQAEAIEDFDWKVIDT